MTWPELLIAAIRFTCILLAYGLFRICHWWVIAVSISDLARAIDSCNKIYLYIISLWFIQNLSLVGYSSKYQ